MTSKNNKNKEQIVLESVHETMTDVANQYVKVLKNEQVIRKDIINNTLHQLHNIQKEKNTLDTLLETTHEARMQQIDNSEAALKQALSTGNVDDIENALKKLME